MKMFRDGLSVLLLLAGVVLFATIIFLGLPYLFGSFLDALSLHGINRFVVGTIIIVVIFAPLFGWTLKK